MKILKRILRLFRTQKALTAIVFMLIGISFCGTSFYTKYNILDMLNSAAIIEILSFGVTMVIICGGIDFSIGSMMSLSGIIVIKLMNDMPIGFAIIIALVCGALVGFINGFLVVHEKTEPFIVTLGMGMLLKGVAQQITDAHPVPAKNLNFMKISNSKIFGSIPSLIVIMLLLLILFYCILRYTSYGRNCYAIGGDYNIASQSGINAQAIKWSTFVICGIVAAFAGVLLSSKLNTGSSIYGDSTALTVNCGCVVGGTSFAGGIGGIPQSFIGILAIQILENCMNMLGISAYIQKVCEGVIILLILWIDNYSQKRAREAV